VSRLGEGAARGQMRAVGRFPAAAQGRLRGWANIVQKVPVDRSHASERTMGPAAV
jgi:hypothetical protein